METDSRIVTTARPPLAWWEWFLVAGWGLASIPAAGVALVVLVVYLVVVVPVYGVLAWRNRRIGRRGGKPWIRLRGGAVPAPWPEQRLPLGEVHVESCEIAVRLLEDAGQGHEAVRVARTAAQARDLLAALTEALAPEAFADWADRVVTYAYEDDERPG